MFGTRSLLMLSAVSELLPYRAPMGGTSLVPRPTLAPSQKGLAHEVEFLGFMGGAISLLIDYSRCETLYKGLLRSLH